MSLLTNLTSLTSGSYRDARTPRSSRPGFRTLPVIGLALLLCGLAAPASAVYEIGDTVADFALTDLEGNPVALYDLDGQVIVLNFFTTWCPGCNEEAEHLQNIWETYQDQDLTVLAVDIQEPAPLVQGWALAMGVNYLIWLSPDWDLFQLFSEGGGIPFNAVLDREMVLRYSMSGFDLLAITEIIEEVLAEDEVATEAGSWSTVKAAYR